MESGRTPREVTSERLFCVLHSMSLMLKKAEIALTHSTDELVGADRG